MPLTDTACKNAKCPEGRPYQRFADTGGLYLEVTAAGSKLWRWKYRFSGKKSASRSASTRPPGWQKRAAPGKMLASS